MNSSSFATRLSVVPLLLVAIGFSVLLWSIPGILHGQQNHPVRRTPTGAQTASVPATSANGIADLQEQVDQIAKEREALKERLDSISHDAATAQWLLAMVLGVAGLLTLAQGAFAFFSAQNYVKQADDAIKRASE